MGILIVMSADICKPHEAFYHEIIFLRNTGKTAFSIISHKKNSFYIYICLQGNIYSNRF